MRKRLLSLLLVLACVLTLAVVPVVAAEPDPVQPTASVTEPIPNPARNPALSLRPSRRPRLRPSLRPYRRRPARGIRRRWILPAITVSCSAIPAAT